MKLLRKSLPFLIASVLASSGCPWFNNPQTNNDDSNVAADSAATADQVSSLSMFATDSINLSMPGLSSDTAAQFAANGTAANLMNAGCLSKTFVGNVVTFTASKCQGPKYGLSDLDGMLKATYTVTGSAAPYTIKVDLSGNPISVNGATLDVRSSAVITISGTSRTTMVTPNNTAATGLHGSKLNLTGSYVAGWDGMCVTLDGNFTTKTSTASWETVIAGYKRCPNSCPASGGSITVSANFHDTSLSFTGNNVANKALDSKASGTFTLGCP